MPIYEFLNTKTKKIEEHNLSITAYDQFKLDNPHLERYFSEAPAFSYSGPGDIHGKKTDNTWKEVLSKIAEKNPGSALADQHLRKTSKRIKTEQVLEKHRKKRSQLANK
jgi:hypothetical protein